MGKSHTSSHHFIAISYGSSVIRSLSCSVKAHVGMGPHAKTLQLSLGVTATQAVELLLASVLATTHVSDT